MKIIFNWVSDNKQWLFSGIGLFALSFTAWIFRPLFESFNTDEILTFVTTHFLKIILFIAVACLIIKLSGVWDAFTRLFDTSGATLEQAKREPTNKASGQCAHTPEERKRLTKILFIDDKTDFKVVSILKKSGWKNTKIVKSVSGVDDKNIADADICFVDINGVAKNLFPKDQGLGLVAAIHERHPRKKVVVYSSQTKRDVFNPLWENAHAKLGKNADPYEFENLVEIYSMELYC